MGNSTIETQLVIPCRDTDPRPGHYLVVFKIDGNGQHYHSTVAPGEKLKRSFFESPRSFLSYAIPRDERLRHEFSLDFSTHDEAHGFKLDLRLEFSIRDPRRLAEGLNRDPLKRLTQEIQGVIEQALKAIDWDAIEKEDIDLEYFLFQRQIRGSSGFDKLSRFASDVGVDLHRIAVVRHLPPNEAEVPRMQAEHWRLRQKRVIEHGTKSLEMGLDQDLDRKKNDFDLGKRLSNEYTETVASKVREGIERADFYDMKNVVDTAKTIHAAAGWRVEPAAPPHFELYGADGQKAIPQPPTSTSPLACFLDEMSSAFRQLAHDQDSSGLIGAALVQAGRILDRSLAADDLQDSLATLRHRFEEYLDHGEPATEVCEHFARLFDVEQLRAELWEEKNG